MLKRQRMLALILMGLIFIGSAAYAEPSMCPYDIHSSIMYDRITDQQRQLFDSMYDGIMLGATTIVVPYGMTNEEVWWMIDFIYNEAAELCAYDRWNTQVMGYKENGEWKPTEIQLAYKRSLEEQEQFRMEVWRIAQYFAFQNAEYGIRNIHDFLAQYFTYGTIDGVDTQLAYEALQYQTAVCNGYAQTAAMLCHFCEYPCSYVDGLIYYQDGSDARHAWNIAKGDNGYFLFDATWDDKGDYAGSEWYGLSDRKMYESRRADPEYVVLPVCW